MMNRREFKVLRSLLAMGCLIALVSCAINETHQKPRMDWPAWLQERLKTELVPVEKYNIQGAEYFLVGYNKICCDRMSKLFDSNGVVICRPSGGIGGGGDSNCPCFVAEFLNLRRCKN